MGYEWILVGYPRGMSMDYSLRFMERINVMSQGQQVSEKNIVGIVVGSNQYNIRVA